MRVCAAVSAFPAHYYDQETLLGALKKFWSERHYNTERLERLHHHLQVGGRHLALPLDEYPRLERWGQANDRWIEVAVELGTQAVERALTKASLRPEDVSALVVVTTTGVATPSLDALLMNRLPLPRGLRRVPLFGLGCAGGTAGLARAAELAATDPSSVAVLLSVELCSLTLQPSDLSVANLIGTGLFADGAAAVVVGTEPRVGTGPRIVDSASNFYDHSEHLMGWDVSERGFGLRLSPEVPAMVEEHLGQDVDAFLARHQLKRADVSRWICHPGGPRVLEAMQRALALEGRELEPSWQLLRTRGNLSSASVLVLLEEVLDDPPAAGAFGLMAALGPGFAAELVLLQW